MKSFVRIILLSSMVCAPLYAVGEIAASAQSPTVVQLPAAVVNESTGVLPAAMAQVPEKPVELVPVVPAPVSVPVAAQVTPEVKPVETQPVEQAVVAPVPTPAPEVKPVEQPVSTQATPDEKPAVSGHAQDLATSEAPTAEHEKEVISQTIEDLASRSKILSSEPEITEQTQPSKELQEERIQSAPVPVPVDHKKFAAEKMQLDLELVPPECVPSTLDTTDVDSGGNWVIKRAFWELAERTYEKIMQANNAIYEQHMVFVKMRNEIDEISDKAFMDLGFKQGQLDTVLARIFEEIKAQHDMQGTLTEPERQLMQSLKDKQQELDQLKLNLQAIDELENALDQAMINLNKQVMACRQYEKQSWDHFKAIGRELNDKKARLLAYEMEGFFKTVEKNREYISGQLRKYFDETISRIKSKFEELKTQLNELKQKGTDLTAEMQRFAKADRDKEQQALGTEKDKLEQERAELARQAQEQAAHKGWFARVKDATMHAADYALDVIVRGISLVKRFIGIK